MPLNRRQFLKIAGISSIGTVIFKACGFAEEEILVESPVQLPEDLVTGPDNWYASVCRQCPAGCGNIVRVMEGRAKKIEGNPNHPISRGKLCVRGQAGLQALYHPDRIQSPKRLIGPRGSDQYENISWEQAESLLVNRLNNTRASRTLLATEPLRGSLAAVTKRFVEGTGIKYHSFETLERTTNLSATMKELFGQETLPEFDIENTKFLMGFGADILETWLSTVRYNRGYGTFRQGNRERGTFVHADSRFSMTAANADEWVPVKPGMEGILALSIAYVIVNEGLGDKKAADAMTNGEGAAALQAFAPKAVENETGVAEQTVLKLARRFATEQPSLAIGGNSAGAYTNGLFNLAAIYSLNVLVGNLGVAGGLHFNPNPISSSVGGGLATSSFKDWQKTLDNDDIDLFMVRNVDPVHGLPTALGFQDKLSRIPFVVSFSSFMDDTTTQADLILPDHTYLESWGDDVPDPGPGYEMITFQQPTVSPFFNTRAFGDVLINLARQMGGAANSRLPWASFKDVVRGRAQELHSLGRGNLSVQGSFDSFWHGLLQRGAWYDVSAKPKTKASAQVLPTTPNKPVFDNPPHEEGFNLIVYQSNAMLDGRLANLPWLQATPDPITTVVWDTWADLSMVDAGRLNIKSNDIVEIRSQHGAIEIPVYVNRGTQPGTVGVPIAQGHTNFGRYATNRGANVLAILAPLTDPNTGNLAWNATKVKVTKTGKEKTLAKYEGIVEAMPAPDTEIIQISRKG